MTAGRPTKYKPEYCEQLIEHMANGFSFEAFAGVVGTSNKTLYSWAEKNEQFLHAKEEGFAKSRAFWEQIGINQAKHGEGNATAFVFNMKNRFPKEWRDKQEIQQETKIKVVPDFSDGD